MARHAGPTAHGSSSRELLGWGAFAVPLAVGVLVLAGAGWPTAAGVGALGAMAFAVVWAVGVLSGSRGHEVPTDGHERGPREPDGT